jgi:glycerophosphoryl diester phosphodiesterase
VFLRRSTARPLVIGHRGAAALAPENTLASLEAAVAAGADLVEFDVDRDAGDTRLVLGHPGRPAADRPLALDDALAYLAGTPIGIHLDLKPVGVEAEIGAAVERHGLAGRVVVSSTSTHSVRRLRVEAPAVARAISYPQDRYGISSVAWPRALVGSAAACVRPLMRARAVQLLAATRADALSFHHALVTPAVVRIARARGAAVLAWTVNEPPRVVELARLGVDAIVSDDPEMTLRVLGTLKSP